MSAYGSVLDSDSIIAKSAMRHTTNKEHLTSLCRSVLYPSTEFPRWQDIHTGLMLTIC